MVLRETKFFFEISVKNWPRKILGDFFEENLPFFKFSDFQS